MNDLSTANSLPTAPTCRARVFVMGLVAAGASLGACIEPTRPVTQADAAADIAVPNEDTSSPGDATPECDVLDNDSCKHLDDGPCLAGACVGDACVAVPVDGECNADSACGSESSGICLDGGCYQQNVGCAGDPVDGCHQSLCGDGGSCGAIPAAGVPCITGAATTNSICSGIRLDPVDVCSAEGACTVRERDSNALPDANAITGSKWWVITHRPADIIGRTRGGLFDFNLNGTWNVDPFGTSIFGTAGSRRSGPWCLDPTGALALALGQEDDATSAIEGAFLGAYARGAALMAGAGAKNNEVLLATRIGGVVADVNGAYTTLLVRKREVGSMGVYAGALNFTTGTLTDADTLVGELPGDLVTFTPATTNFGLPNADGLVSLTAEFTEPNNKTTQVEYVGAIAPGGGTIVMSPKLEVPTRLDHGFIVMFRAYNNQPGPVEGTDPTWWNAALQIGPPPTGPNTNFTSTSAIFHARGTEVLGGIFGTDGDIWSSTKQEGRILGGKLTFSRSGVIGAELNFATATRRFSGFMHPSLDFGVVFDAGDKDLTKPDTLPVTPQSKTFGFLIRRYETATTLGTAN